jgi:DMSO/TMAO reductase YedYZ heme-binding membrane subunit
MSPRLKMPSNDPPSALSSRNIAITTGITIGMVVLLCLIVIVGGDAVRTFLDYGAGVVSLLSLSGAVVWGLVARDRVFLAPRQRLLAQAVHRATAILSVTFLILHVAVKLYLDHIPLYALAPFGLGFTASAFLITLGPLAGYCLITAAITGALRRSFIAPGGEIAAKWRAIHSLAYPAWSFALIHGLFAGRPAVTWVMVMYSLTVLGVTAAVSIRLLPVPTKRRLANRLLELLQPGQAAPVNWDGDVQRNTAISPLPGGGSVPLSAPAASTPAGLGGSRSAPSASPPPQMPRIRPPQPPLYEAPRRTDGLAEGMSGVADVAGASSGSSSGPDTGSMTAAYRAVSTPANATMAMPTQLSEPLTERPPRPGPSSFVDPGAFDDSGRFSGTGQFSGTGEFSGTGQFTDTGQFGDTGQFSAEPPLAERIPMTEELPVIEDFPRRAPASPTFQTSATTPWPTPFPSPPFEASQDEPANPAAAAWGNDDTAMTPGPLYPPPTGEPWTAPAGERP